MTSQKLLTFELSADGSTLDIHMDRTGIADLIKYLQRLANGHEPLPRHDHLMSPSWAGNELTEEKQSENAKLINQVVLRLWR